MLYHNLENKKFSLSNSLDNISAVLGPTNTGKTYYAFERFVSFKSGIFGFPLRLLARENYDKALKKVGVNPFRINNRWNLLHFFEQIHIFLNLVWVYLLCVIFVTLIIITLKCIITSFEFII